MKICIVIPSFYPATVYGGPLHSSLAMAQSLARIGHDVRVCTTNANGNSHTDVQTNQWIELEERLHAKYYHDTIPTRLSIGMILGLYFDLKWADIVYVQAIFSIPTPLALIYSFLRSKPVVITPRGALGQDCLDHGPSGFKSLWLKLGINPWIKSVGWQATSSKEKEEILTHYSSAKVEVIPNGIHLEDYSTLPLVDRTQYLNEFGIDARPATEDPIFICLSRLHPIKGLDRLIRAFHIYFQEKGNGFLLLAGNDDGILNDLKALVSELQLDSRVSFPGIVHGESKLRFLSGGDLFVLPSHTENFGLVYAEALASGTPIIASKNTPWSEIEEIACGKWVENEPQVLATTMIELIDNSNLEEMGRTGRNWVLSQFDWTSLAKKLARLLESQLLKD